MLACLLAAASGCQFDLELVRGDSGAIEDDGATIDDAGGSASDSGDMAVNPCAGTITTLFDFEGLSPTDWEFFAYGATTSSLEDGRLKVEHGSADSGGGIFEYNTHDITGAAVITRVRPPPDLSGRFAAINLRQADVEDPANLVLELNNGQVIAYHDGVLVFQTNYQPPEELFLRIAHAGDSDFDFDSSEDGVSWTTWHTVTDSVLDLELRASLATGSYVAENGTSATYYDDLIWCQL